jgi:predicted CopG family antitoxin
LENKISESTEVEDEQSVSNVVADFLAKQTKNSKFLQNVGLGKVQAATSVRKFEAKLAAEKSANANLQLLVSKQRERIDVMSMKFQESEQARITDKFETDKKLELLLNRLNTI